MLSKEIQVKKRHHYVWANYLARWGNGTKNVFYTTKNGNFANDSVRAIVVDDYFYKTTALSSKHVKLIKDFSRKSPDHLHLQHMSYLNDFLVAQNIEAIFSKSGIQDKNAEKHLQALRCNLLENLHASHEAMVIPVMSALAEEKLHVLEDKQHMIEYMTFLGHQISRTKTFRDSAIAAQHRRNHLEIEVANTIEHAWWFLSYMFGMNIGFSLYSNRSIARHALLINDTNVPFITSDQPVVNVHPCVSEIDFAAPEHADFYYPISPRIAYIICDSDRFIQGGNVVDESTATELNSKVAAQAMVHIIGDTENAIRPFKKYIGLRYQKSREVHVIG